MLFAWSERDEEPLVVRSGMTAGAEPRRPGGACHVMACDLRLRPTVLAERLDAPRARVQLPGDAVRVGHPHLVRAGVAAPGAPRFQVGQAAEAVERRGPLNPGIGPDPEVVHAGDEPPG